jgi:DNA-binding transcriptional ArsR family regulator
MGVGDLGRMRFAYSPLAEVAESLYLLASGRIPSVHREWYDAVRHRLGGIDVELLRAVVPGTSFVPSYLFGGATSPGTSIDEQLGQVAELPPELIQDRLDYVWQGEPLPPAALALIAEGPAGPRHLADALGEFWSVAVEPHWPSIRPVLDDDVAFRAAELTRRGAEAMLSGLHPEVTVHGETMRIAKKADDDRDLSGAGLVLVPSVFSWPNVIFVPGTDRPSVLTYAARGVGNVWGGHDEDRQSDEDALGALIGRSRAAILLTLGLPHSTTELALKLGQSPPAVSQHLAVLRRSGLVTSWRNGRSVLYRRTPLATSVVEAHQSGAASDTGS